MTWLALFLAGGLGAASRYIVDYAVTARTASAFGWGTWIVNVSGSLVLGVIAGLAARSGGTPPWRLVAAGGFCGAYTTFSTWMYETVRGAEDGAWLPVVLHLLSLAVGVAAIAAGWWLAAVSLGRS
jgi:CrcB protein